VPSKKYIVELSQEERKSLREMISSGKSSAKKILRARVLLKTDDGWIDREIAEALEVTAQTIERMREQFVEEGFESFMAPRKSGRKYLRKLDGKQEAQLTTIACSEPPEGQARWTLRLLSDRIVQLDYVDSVSYETVRRVLKKTSSSRG
jgi:transposase